MTLCRGRETSNMRRKRKRLGRNSRYAVIPTSSGRISSTPPQQVKTQQELEREKERKEALELRKLEVRCNLRPFCGNPALTLSQEEKRRKELDHEEREARELREKLKARCIPHIFRQNLTVATP